MDNLLDLDLDLGNDFIQDYDPYHENGHEDNQEKICKHCNNPFFTSNYRKLYCTDSCRSRYNYINYINKKRKKVVPLKKSKEKKCKYCNNPFSTINNRKLYCTESCSQMSRNKTYKEKIKNKPLERIDNYNLIIPYENRCKGCNNIFPITNYKKLYCTKNCRKRFHDNNYRNKIKNNVLDAVKCSYDECYNYFIPSTRKKYCSEECTKYNHNKIRREHRQKKRIKCANDECYNYFMPFKSKKYCSDDCIKYIRKKRRKYKK